VLPEQAKAPVALMLRGGTRAVPGRFNGCRFVVADLGLPRLMAGIRIACLHGPEGAAG
jgi:hypothetical protein